MKRALLPVLLSLPLIHVVAACSGEDAPPVVPGTGGSGGSPTGANGGSAGTGTTPSAGTGTTSAGTGTSSSGAGGTGSSMAGTSSTAGTGGAGVSGSSSGGSGGSSAGSGGSGGAPPAAVSLGKLDGMLVMTPCKDSQTDDCDGDGWIYENVTNPCVGGNLDTDSVPGKLEFAVTGGEAGKRYIAKMHFYGVMEPKDYGPNDVREAGTTRPNVNATPSTPPPFATMPPGMSYRTSDYNTYEVHTYDDKGVHLQQHFINSDHNMEGHYTFGISYPHDIEVVGGGKVKVRIFDDNCRMIKNCGNGGSVNECTTKARSIDVSGASPQPMGLQQPGLGNSAEQSGQWFFIDVKEIVPKP
jgi:hypothetical protein